MRLLVSLALGLLTACSGSATGECQGTLSGQAVSWPIDSGDTKVFSTRSERYGTVRDYARLLYTSGEDRQFGVELELGVNSIEREEGPRIVNLRGSSTGITTEDPAIVSWQGWISDETGSGTGFMDPPGIPQDVTLRIDRILNNSSGTFFNGSFTYRYADGSALDCSFDIES